MNKFKYSIVLSILVIISIFWGLSGAAIYTKVIASSLSLVSVFTYLKMCSLIKSKYVFGLLIILGYLFFCFSFIYLIVYRQSISYDVFRSIIDTNMGEFVSYLKDFTTYLLVIPVIFVVYHKSCLEFQAFKINFLNSLLLYFMSAVLPVALLFSLLILKNYQKSSNDIYRHVLFTYGLGVNEVIGSQISSLNAYNCVSSFFYFNAFLANKFDLLKYFDTDKKLQSGLTNKTDSQPVNTVILVLGESASSFHMSCYGYDVKTTSFLDSLALYDKEKVNFYPAISSYQYTRTAVPSILTSQSAFDDADNSIINTKNIIHLAQDLGFTTYWLSNQKKSGRYEGEISLISETCDYQSFTKKNFGVNDFDLLSVFYDNYNPEKKQFFVIHLIGSHTSFSDKYDEIDMSVIDRKDKVGEYDCSIHHTDRFLDSLVNNLCLASNFTLFYVSDHGENPHSLEGRYSKDGYSFYVPLIVYNNSSINVDSICCSYIGEKYLNTCNTFYILSEVIGYSVSRELKKESIKRGEYVKVKDSASKEPIHYSAVPMELKVKTHYQ